MPTYGPTRKPGMPAAPVNPLNTGMVGAAAPAAAPPGEVAGTPIRTGANAGQIAGAPPPALPPVNPGAAFDAAQVAMRANQAQQQQQAMRARLAPGGSVPLGTNAALAARSQRMLANADTMAQQQAAAQARMSANQQAAQARMSANQQAQIDRLLSRGVDPTQIQAIQARQEAAAAQQAQRFEQARLGQQARQAMGQEQWANRGALAQHVLADGVVTPEERRDRRHVLAQQKNEREAMKMRRGIVRGAMKPPGQ